MDELKKNGEVKRKGIKDGPISRDRSNIIDAIKQQEGRTDHITRMQADTDARRKKASEVKKSYSASDTRRSGSSNKTKSKKKLRRRPRRPVGAASKVKRPKNKNAQFGFFALRSKNTQNRELLLEKTEKRLFKCLLWALGGVTLVALCVASWYFLRVNTVNVVGVDDNKSREVIMLASIDEGEFILTSGFYNAESYIESNPYYVVESIDFVFPDTVTINVSERVAVAALIGTHNAYLMDIEGRVLEITPAKDLNLVSVHGLALIGANVGSIIGESVDMRINTLIDIIKQLTENELTGQIESIDMANPLSIRLVTTSNITVMLGTPEKLSAKFAELTLALTEMDALGYTGGVLTLNGSGKVAYTPSETATPAPVDTATPNSTQTPAPSDTNDASATQTPEATDVQPTDMPLETPLP